MVTEITMKEMQPGGMESNAFVHVIMFYGKTCGPCKATMPFYEELANYYIKQGHEIEFFKIDAWDPPEQKEYCKNVWKLPGVPHFKIFHHGREIHSRSGGGNFKALSEFLEEGLYKTNFSSTNMKIKKVIDIASLPQKAHAGDLGYDLFAAEDISIFPGETKLISTGVAIQFPVGYGGIIKDRSSIATKRKLFTVAGVIDNGYVGELKVALHNSGYNLQKIETGDKIAQLVLIPVTNFNIEEVEEVYSADQRGEGGFGSTGT
jgi:dUTP pyrophosphatase